ncbi:hypothetical protein NECAME_16544 [Necator americanus]|uniref:Uncharacterized protein n=1 Tax=Necator americanus TaxID=51031 RepID=W2TVY3_NECAM|nr:hypothetical protein NECAME_16544 [Necator americanus]ETN85993.1 hypothetical protein NECAME_16544 [Necator americanus]
MIIMKIEHKIACFFVVFGTVYFLESIGGFYMTRCEFL